MLSSFVELSRLLNLSQAPSEAAYSVFRQQILSVDVYRSIVKDNLKLNTCFSIDLNGENVKEGRQVWSLHQGRRAKLRSQCDVELPDGGRRHNLNQTRDVGTLECVQRNAVVNSNICQHTKTDVG